MTMHATQSIACTELAAPRERSSIIAIRGWR